MAYFPFFMDLEGREGLVVGGGPVALRKIRKILPYGPRLTVAAPELLPEIAALPGGRVAESLFLDDISTGASNDIQRATAMARKMVTSYGMSEKLGAVSFDSGHDEVFIGRSMAQAKTYSEETANLIDEEVKALLDEAYRTCETILKRDRVYLDKVAEYLLEHEVMDAETFEKMMEG